MNSNCRQRLAALLEGKEGISQSICQSKNCLNCHALNACHFETEYEFSHHCELKLCVLVRSWKLFSKNVGTFLELVIPPFWNTVCFM